VTEVIHAQLVPLFTAIDFDRLEEWV